MDEERKRQILETARAGSQMWRAEKLRRAQQEPDYTNIIPIPARTSQPTQQEPRRNLTDAVVHRLVDELRADTADRLEQHRAFIHGVLVELVADIENKQADDIEAITQDLADGRSQLDELSAKLDDLESQIADLAAATSERAMIRTTIEAHSEEIRNLWQYWKTTSDRLSNEISRSGRITRLQPIA